MYASIKQSINIKFTVLAAVVLFHFLLPQATLAQPGKPDLTFNTSDDGVFGDGPVLNSGIYSFAHHATTGQLVMAGGFNSFNNTTNWANMVGLTAVGAHYIPYNPRPVGRVRVLTPVASGKMYVGGDFTNFVGSGQQYLARINAAGTPDAGFVTGTGPSSSVFCVIEQPDGKVLLGGNFSTFNGTTVNRITRLTNAGAIDAGFLSGTGANNQVLAMGLQSDGKIIITGTFTSYNGIACNRIARLNTDGSFDNTFSIGTGLNNPALSMQITADNKIYLGGLFSAYNGAPAYVVLKLNADGTLDNSFNSSQPSLNGVETISLQPDGKLMVGGGVTQYNGTAVNRIFRVNADGSIDASFNVGSGANSTVRAIYRQSDGTYMVGGDFTFMNGQPRKYFVKLFANGSIDYSYAKLPGANFLINTVAVQADEKILVGGRFTSLNNTPKQYLGRLNADGSVDPTFDAGTSAEAQVYGIGVQSTGKIVYAHQYTLGGSGAVQNCLKRLNTDGSEDNTFIKGRCNFFGGILKLTMAQDDKMFIAGDFNSFTTLANGSISRAMVAKVNADGSIDQSFAPPVNPNNRVDLIAVQPDGKVLLYGGFTNMARFIRLNADGTIDNTFVPGTGFGTSTLYDIVVQPDGKILVGGNFTSYNGATHNNIVRLLDDGSVDPSFITGTGFTGAVGNILVQADGKIIVEGTITSYQGVSFTGQAARLNPDGSRDLCYNAGVQANNSVTTMVSQNMNNIIMVGDFTAVNQVRRHRIARIYAGSCALPVTLLDFKARPAGKAVLLQWTTGSEQNSSHFIIERSFNGTSYEEVGRVSAAGNSAVNRYYHFTDPLGGLFTPNKNIFYRIKMVDLDASSTLSETRTLKLSGAAEVISLFTNPVNDKIEFMYNAQSSGPAFINLHNAAGSLVYRQNITTVQGSNFIKIPAGPLADGIYYLSIVQQSQTASTRILKSR